MNRHAPSRNALAALVAAVTIFFAGLGATAQAIVAPPSQQQPAPAAVASPSPEKSPASSGEPSSATTTPSTPSSVATTPESAPPAAPDAGNAAAPPASSAAAPKPAKGGSAAVTVPPEKAAPIQIKRFDKAPLIDGKLDEEVWQQATVFKDFVQIRPGDNLPPSKPTEALVGYDAKFLYIAFRAFDEPDKVRATIPKRDDIFNDDWLGVILDTYNDNRKGYELFFNPLGVQADSVITEGRGEDFSVDIVMESKGVLGENGYTVEVAVPFKSLRYEAGKGKLWGIHFLRVIKRFNNEQDSWMPISRENSALLSQAGRITGLEDISTERTLEIIPSLTLSETGRRVATLDRSVVRGVPDAVDPGRFVNQPVELDPGLTVKYGITPTITLDLALNPDFAQVEADATVVTANQRFPIFFSEKRPFFLEGIDIFRTSNDIVHTRAIIDPDVAVKLTGKRGRNTFGLLLASDNAPGNFSEDERNDPETLPDIQRFIDKNAYVGVLRLKRDIGKENSIGMIATSYNFIEKHNDTLGFDGRFRLDKQTVMDFQVIGTTSRNFFYDPNRDESIYRTGNAFAYSFRYEKNARNWGFNFDGRGRTRDYRADVGFTRRTNNNREGLFVYYRSEPKPKAKLIRWTVNNVVFTQFDFQGRQQETGNETSFELTFPLQSFFGGGVFGGHERLIEEEFGPKRTAERAGAFFGDDSERTTNYRGVYFYAGTTPSKKYSFFGFLGMRRGIFDLDFGAGSKFPRISPAAIAARERGESVDDVALDPGPGKTLDWELRFVHQPTDALRTTFNYIRNNLIRDDTGLTAFEENIFTVRSTYQFTRFTSLRARIDYSTLASRVRGQFLVGWTPNPGTSFFVGYNDDLNRNGFNPFTGNLEPGLRRNGRTFFIKASYLIRRSF